MPTHLEINRELPAKLFDLLWIKKLNPEQKIKGLGVAISRTKAVLTKESIAWVEQTVSELDVEG